MGNWTGEGAGAGLSLLYSAQADIDESDSRPYSDPGDIILTGDPSTGESDTLTIPGAAGFSSLFIDYHINLSLPSARSNFGPYATSNSYGSTKLSRSSSKGSYLFTGFPNSNWTMWNSGTFDPAEEFLVGLANSGNNNPWSSRNNLIWGLVLDPLTGTFRLNRTQAYSSRATWYPWLLELHVMGG